MENRTDLIFVAVAGLVGWYFFRRLNASVSQSNAMNALQNAGAKTYTTNTGAYAQIYSGGENITFKIPSDGLPLNLAQKILIGMDRFVPGEILTRWALT